MESTQKLFETNTKKTTKRTKKKQQKKKSGVSVSASNIPPSTGPHSSPSSFSVSATDILNINMAKVANITLPKAMPSGTAFMPPNHTHDIDLETKLHQSAYICLVLEKNYTKAAKIYRLLAEKGNFSAQYSLGILYYKGIGVEKNLQEAVKLFRLAAEQGDKSSQYYLGLCYQHALGVEKDEKEAIRLFQLAAAQKLTEALSHLGDIYKNGLCSVEVNLEQSVKYSELAKQPSFWKLQRDVDYLENLENKSFSPGSVSSTFNSSPNISSLPSSSFSSSPSRSSSAPKGELQVSSSPTLPIKSPPQKSLPPAVSQADDTPEISKDIAKKDKLSPQDVAINTMNSVYNSCKKILESLQDGNNIEKKLKQLNNGISNLAMQIEHARKKQCELGKIQEFENNLENLKKDALKFQPPSAPQTADDGLAQPQIPQKNPKPSNNKQNNRKNKNKRQATAKIAKSKKLNKSQNKNLKEKPTAPSEEAEQSEAAIPDVDKNLINKQDVPLEAKYTGEEPSVTVAINPSVNEIHQDIFLLTEKNLENHASSTFTDQLSISIPKDETPMTEPTHQASDEILEIFTEPEILENSDDKKFSTAITERSIAQEARQAEVVMPNTDLTDTLDVKYTDQMRNEPVTADLSDDMDYEETSLFTETVENSFSALISKIKLEEKTGSSHAKDMPNLDQSENNLQKAPNESESLKQMLMGLGVIKKHLRATNPPSENPSSQPINTKRLEKFTVDDLKAILTAEDKLALLEIAKLKNELANYGIKLHLHSSFNAKCLYWLLARKPFPANDIDVVIELPWNISLKQLLSKVPLTSRSFSFVETGSGIGFHSFSSTSKQSTKIDLTINDINFVKNTNPFYLTDFLLDININSSGIIELSTVEPLEPQAIEDVIASKFPVNSPNLNERTNIRNFIPRLAKYMNACEVSSIELRFYCYTGNNKKIDISHMMDVYLEQYFTNVFRPLATSTSPVPFIEHHFHGMMKMIEEGNFIQRQMKIIIAPFCMAYLSSSARLNLKNPKDRSLAGNNLASILQFYFETHFEDFKHFRKILDLFRNVDPKDLKKTSNHEWVVKIKQQLTSPSDAKDFGSNPLLFWNSTIRQAPAVINPPPHITPVRPPAS